MTTTFESIDQIPGRDIKCTDMDKISLINDVIRENSFRFYIKLTMSSPRFDMQVTP